MSYPNQPPPRDPGYDIRVRGQQPDYPNWQDYGYPPAYQQPAAPVYYPSPPPFPPADQQLASRVSSGGAHVAVAALAVVLLGIAVALAQAATHIPLNTMLEFTIIPLMVGAFIVLEIYGAVTFIRGVIVHSLAQSVSGAVIIIVCVAIPILLYLAFIGALAQAFGSYSYPYPQFNR